jgi:hypothetical protein
MLTTNGGLLFAFQDGHYVVKFIGDVRLTLCSTIDQHLRSMLSRDDVTHTLIDLTETTNIDSTSLGLIAKLAVKAPSVICLAQPLFQLTQTSLKSYTQWDLITSFFY